MKQKPEILNHLEAGGTLTALEALNKFGCLRLASRISELKKAGYAIESQLYKDDKTGKRYSKYWLPIKEVGGQLFFT